MEIFFSRNVEMIHVMTLWGSPCQVKVTTRLINIPVQYINLLAATVTWKLFPRTHKYVTQRLFI